MKKQFSMEHTLEMLFRTDTHFCTVLFFKFPRLWGVRSRCTACYRKNNIEFRKADLRLSYTLGPKGNGPCCCAWHGLCENSQQNLACSVVGYLNLDLENKNFSQDYDRLLTTGLISTFLHWAGKTFTKTCLATFFDDTSKWGLRARFCAT